METICATKETELTYFILIHQLAELHRLGSISGTPRQDLGPT